MGHMAYETGYVIVTERLGQLVFFQFTGNMQTNARFNLRVFPLENSRVKNVSVKLPSHFHCLQKCRLCGL